MASHITTQEQIHVINRIKDTTEYLIVAEQNKSQLFFQSFDVAESLTTVWRPFIGPNHGVVMGE